MTINFLSRYVIKIAILFQVAVFSRKKKTFYSTPAAWQEVVRGKSAILSELALLTKKTLLICEVGAPW